MRLVVLVARLQGVPFDKDYIQPRSVVWEYSDEVYSDAWLKRPWGMIVHNDWTTTVFVAVTTEAARETYGAKVPPPPLRCRWVVTLCQKP